MKITEKLNKNQRKIILKNLKNKEDNKIKPSFKNVVKREITREMKRKVNGSVRRYLQKLVW